MNPTKTDRYDGNYVVKGPPGTGKTTFLASRVRRAVESGDTVMVCSLTKAAEREVRGRGCPVPREAIGTLHSHAYRSIGRPQVVGGKDLKLWNEERPAWRMSGASGDADEMYAVGDEPGDKMLARLDLARHRRQDVLPADVAAFSGAWSSWKAALEVIDYTDMIEIALRDMPNAPGSPMTIFADEAQDLSRLEYDLLMSWSRWTMATIIIGDPWQSLYVWRGADPTTFDDPETPDAHRGVLSQSYRVPRSVHAAAIKWVEGLSDYRQVKYAPRDAEGFVRRSSATWTSPETMLPEIERHLDDGKSVMVLASANYLIAPTVEALRKAMIPFCNPWRSYRSDWNPLGRIKDRVSSVDRVESYLRPTEVARRIHDSDGCEYCGGTSKIGAGPCRWCLVDTVESRWTCDDLHQWASVIVAKGVLIRGGKQSIVDWAKDRGDQNVTDSDLIKSFEPELIEWLRLMNGGRVSVPDATAWLRPKLLAAKSRLLGFILDMVHRRGVDVIRTEPKLYVGTIHSFKGGEADIVYVIPEYSFQAHRAAMQSVEGRDSIVRMFYVALTRAREGVVLCRSTDVKSARFVA